MKTFVLAGAIAMTIVSGQAIAACTGTNLNATQIGTLLGGNTVCVPAVTVDPMTWQELHNGSTTGTLVDYKRGPGHATDPSETVGSWSIGGTGSNRTVIHNYGSGGTYEYLIYNNGNGTYSFCPVSGGTEIVARVKPGGGAC